jgi:glycine/D-amino acid oxidase-like deaminating enzyme
VYTNTPADTLTTCPTTRKHTITTSTRGSIVATSVITTTNAFTAGLLPRFQNRIIPVRGTACSIQPAPSHSLGSLPGPLRLSYGLSNGNGAMDYMICRQGRGRVPGHGDKSYILGGAKAIFAHDLPSWYNNIRDDEQIPGAVEYFQLQMQRRMKDWRGEKKPGNVDMVWSGGEKEMETTQVK